MTDLLDQFHRDNGTRHALRATVPSEDFELVLQGAQPFVDARQLEHHGATGQRVRL